MRCPETFENETVELYRLDQDKGENNNLAEAESDRATEMLQRLKSWSTEVREDATPQPGGWAERNRFFNGKDLTGWSGNEGYWSVEDGAIVGHSDGPVRGNQFLWSEVPVKDFYLSVDVKLTPADRNAGIQFRSIKINDKGQARGYQADIGKDIKGWHLWGKLYHEHGGRGKLDWNDRALEVVKPEDWNRCEILAIGDRIWTAVNGTLCVALRDPEGEREGLIALQIHGGPPQTVRYRNPSLIHDPPVSIAGLNEEELEAALTTYKKKPGKKTAAAPGLPSQTPRSVGGLVLEDDDVVAFLGGAGMVEQVRSAALETFLTHATAGRVHFRDQSWQADTVYRRQRPLNFGSQGDMHERIGTTAVIASFGQMEAMDGVGRLPEFIQAYERFSRRRSSASHRENRSHHPDPVHARRRQPAPPRPHRPQRRHPRLLARHRRACRTPRLARRRPEPLRRHRPHPRWPPAHPGRTEKMGPDRHPQAARRARRRAS